MTNLSFLLTGIELDDAAGFAPGQVLYPGPELTIIEGTNGSGKTRLVNALKSHVSAALLQMDHATPQALLSLIFVDKRNIISLGQESQFLKELVGVGEGATHTARMTSEVATGIWQDANMDYDPRRAQASIHVSHDGEISMQTSDGNKPMNDYYSAMGERVSVDLAIRIALRKTLGLTVPMVMDDIIDCLSFLSADRLFRMLAAHPSECIVMAHPFSNVKATATRFTLASGAAGTQCLPLPNRD